MRAKAINNNLSVARQIATTDIRVIAKAGFKSVVCNRPDGEGGDQPPFAEISTAAMTAECPLTVERGNIVFAAFGSGEKLLPTFPNWLVDPLKPSRLAWVLKERTLPPFYWNAMLKGKEWYAKPELVG